MSTDHVSEAILAMEEPLRVLGDLLARDEVESIIGSCLDDVYEDES